MEEEDDRREAAIASAAQSLNPKLTPSSSSSSQARLSKFQELHKRVKRRLQIKEKSKIKKKSKGRSSGPSRLEDKGSHAEKCSIDIQGKTTQDTSNPASHEEDVAPQKTSMKPQKLHWGLDTKERWERKSNM